jgi:RNA polymerase sigma-B factor
MSTVAGHELVVRYYERGEHEARDALIEAYLPLARAIARRYAGRGEALDDLYQVASVGLIKAIDRYDIARGFELESYAVPTIVGEIKRHFRDRAWAVHVPRRLKELNMTLTGLVESMSARLGRSPTVTELAEEAGVEPEEAVEALDSGRAYSTVSLATPAGDDRDIELIQTIESDEDPYGRADDRALVAERLEALDSREQAIIRLRFFEGMTQAQIATTIGISQMHVSRLIRRSLTKMREGIEPAGGGESP